MHGLGAWSAIPTPAHLCFWNLMTSVYQAEHGTACTRVASQSTAIGRVHTGEGLQPTFFRHHLAQLSTSAHTCLCRQTILKFDWLKSPSYPLRPRHVPTEEGDMGQANCSFHLILNRITSERWLSGGDGFWLLRASFREC